MRLISKLFAGLAATVAVTGVTLAAAPAADAATTSGCGVSSSWAVEGGAGVTMWCPTPDGMGRQAYTAYGNTAADAVTYATWLTQQASGTKSCTASVGGPVPGGYTVILTCFTPSGARYASGTAGDYNNASAWANYYSLSL